jgi:hypothetical protein
MERYCSTGQRPKRAVAPTEEEVVLSVVNVFLVHFDFLPQTGTQRSLKEIS